MPYDYNRPFVPKEDLEVYETNDKDVARKYGKRVKATELSNKEYKYRFDRFHLDHEMKPPPSSGRIFPGFLVIRKLGTPDEYETWMPDHVFDEIYAKRG